MNWVELMDFGKAVEMVELWVEMTVEMKVEMTAENWVSKMVYNWVALMAESLAELKVG